MWLLAVAAFGFFVPNGLFVYWLVHEFTSLGQALSDRLALAFMLDLFAATALLTYLVAVRPPGRVRWPWFLFLSLLGGLGFSIPLYLWLNWRAAPNPGISFRGWWRSV
jgi:hypothetical protein